MPNLQTKVKIDPPGFNIGYSQNILFMGSCFSDNIGNKLQRLKFQVDVNPFGVLYNPASVTQAINLLLDKESFSETDLQFRNELWFSFNHHTTFSHCHKNECLDVINNSFKTAQDVPNVINT